MNKDICNECSYQLDRDKLLANLYIGWGSTEPHPCTICMRFPREPMDYHDNFELLHPLADLLPKDYCTCAIPQALNTCPICKKLIKQ